MNWRSSISLLDIGIFGEDICPLFIRFRLIPNMQKLFFLNFVKIIGCPLSVVNILSFSWSVVEGRDDILKPWGHVSHKVLVISIRPVNSDILLNQEISRLIKIPNTCVKTEFHVLGVLSQQSLHNFITNIRLVWSIVYPSCKVPVTKADFNNFLDLRIVHNVLQVNQIVSVEACNGANPRRVGIIFLPLLLVIATPIFLFRCEATNILLLFYFILTHRGLFLRKHEESNDESNHYK